MDLRGCSCTGGVPQTMLCGFLPLRTQTARRFPTSIRSAKKPKDGGLAVKARCYGDDHESGSGGPSMVDADMIVLRKRMYELKHQENNYESPEEWTEWEKKWQGRYHSCIFQAMESLQYNLINTRPALGITFLGLVSVSVPASVALVLMTCAAHLTALIDSGHVQ